MNSFSITHISVVIIVKNAAATIEATLASLDCFSEVVLYDNGSSDETLNIAAAFSNVKIIQGEFTGFGETKNNAVSFASNDWIFSLDADEVPTVEFISHLATLDLDKNSAYQINRVNYYKSTPIKHCWGNDVITRVYHRAVTSFNNNKVHEFIITDGLQVNMLPENVLHYPYSNLSDFIVKADNYSSLFAKDNQGTKSSSPLKAFLNGLFSFVKTYFLKRGFLDGYPGLVIAFSHMTTNFFKYMKLYEANKEQLTQPLKK
ncbi:MAG: glycosyltransferase family 2 protein [Oceanospirillaceae bacterium]